MLDLIVSGLFDSQTPGELREMIRRDTDLVAVLNLKQYRWMVKLAGGTGVADLTASAVLAWAKEKYPLHYAAVESEPDGRMWVMRQVQGIKTALG